MNCCSCCCCCGGGGGGRAVAKADANAAEVDDAVENDDFGWAGAKNSAPIASRNSVTATMSGRIRCRTGVSGPSMR